MNDVLAIVLAAGKGVRMKSDLPKVLVEVCGRPMVEYVLDALHAAGVSRIALVVGYRSDLVRKSLADRAGLVFVEQAEQRGTGHAVMVCRDVLRGHQGPVLILAGDSPLVQPQTLRTLGQEFQRLKPACLLGTAHKENPHGLGRIVRDAEGNFRRIVEEKDATPLERALTEVNMSTYVFDSADLVWALSRVQSNNAQGEYYLTDCPSILLAAGKTVHALPVLLPIETLSINTRDELAVVEAALRNQK